MERVVNALLRGGQYVIGATKTLRFGCRLLGFTASTYVAIESSNGTPQRRSTEPYMKTTLMPVFYHHNHNQVAIMPPIRESAPWQTVSTPTCAQARVSRRKKQKRTTDTDTQPQNIWLCTNNTTILHLVFHRSVFEA